MAPQLRRCGKRTIKHLVKYTLYFLCQHTAHQHQHQKTTRIVISPKNSTHFDKEASNQNK